VLNFIKINLKIFNNRLTKIRFIQFCFFYFIFLHIANSQKFELKTYFGAFYYQGDLVPRPINLSMSQGDLATGLSFGYSVNDWSTISGRFLCGKLSGDDKYANTIERKTRNLSFVSPLYEYGLYVDLKINKIWKSLNKYKINLYYSTGISLFTFNPKTWYNNRLVDLHPLGTEGQNIPKYAANKYKLTQIAIPFGIVIDFDVTNRLGLGLEVSPRKTFTDYLDDVSSFYINYHEMISYGNILGAKLSNRQGEYYKTEVVILETGTQRGDPKNNDWYTHFTIYGKYRFGKIQQHLSKAEIQIPLLESDIK